MKEVTKDFITNTWLSIKSHIRYYLGYKQGNEEPKMDPSTVVLYDDFLYFDDKRWLKGQPWGEFHPEYPYQYYDADSVESSWIGLRLKQSHKPRTFNTANDNITIPYAVGLVTSKQYYGYGFFKFKVQLPRGIGLWPAVWLTPSDVWPPEIDITEGYSDDKGKYRTETNIHYVTKTSPHLSTGGINHPVNAGAPVYFSCYWTENFIKIYYNGYLVRQVTDPIVLESFKGKQMMIVLNNAIRREYVNKIGDQASEAIIYNVKIHSI